MTDTTILALVGIGIPPYSARGLKQTLAPIDQAKNLHRTINAELMDLGDALFLKYKSTITGTDQQPPAFDGVWSGTQLTVDCIVELAVAESASPLRTPVFGSEHTEDGFTFYRPQLEMIVMDFNIQTDEYGAQVGWTLDLEEA